MIKEIIQKGAGDPFCLIDKTNKFGKNYPDGRFDCWRGFLPSLQSCRLGGSGLNPEG